MKETVKQRLYDLKCRAKQIRPQQVPEPKCIESSHRVSNPSFFHFSEQKLTKTAYREGNRPPIPSQPQAPCQADVFPAKPGIWKHC